MMENNLTNGCQATDPKANQKAGIYTNEMSSIEKNGSRASFSDLIRPDLKDYCPASNLAFNEKVKELQARGETIHHFGFGQAPFPVMKHMEKALQENAHQNAYLPVAGTPALRQVICEFHSRHDSLHDLDPEQVIVGPGTKELFFLLMTVFNGDVLVVSPSWTTYKPQAQLSHHKPYLVHTSAQEQWRITPQQLEKTITENNLTGNILLILCNPDNPTGTVYEKEHLLGLSTVLRRHNVIVLSDEIYGRLHYTQSHDTLFRYYPEGTILSSGMSKFASAGGWRLGYNIFPRELFALRDAVRSAASHSYSCAAAPTQYAVAQALKNHNACDSYIFHTTRIMKAVAEFVTRELSSVGVKCCMPHGGYYIFPDLEIVRPSLNNRGLNTGAQMCEAIFQEARVALMSGGPAFQRPIEELTVRLCFVNFNGKEALEESERMGSNKTLPNDFVQKYCTPVFDGIMALKQWVQKQIV